MVKLFLLCLSSHSSWVDLGSSDNPLSVVRKAKIGWKVALALTDGILEGKLFLEERWFLLLEYKGLGVGRECYKEANWSRLVWAHKELFEGSSTYIFNQLFCVSTSESGQFPPKEVVGVTWCFQKRIICKELLYLVPVSIVNEKILN